MTSRSDLVEAPERPPPNSTPQPANVAGSVRASLFVPGVNCWRVARANRISLIVDGEAYFKAFAQAALRAERTIDIVGWDFHSRTQLHHCIPGVPEHLGDFLNFLVKRRRQLEVRILTWDYPVIFAKGRELSPIYGLGWRPRRRVRLRYDDHYPIGASQHQKVVVIDGALGFCGGLDLTLNRWDTPEHGPNEPRRINEGSTDAYAPFHDTAMAVDGEAAAALADLVRDRWERATGEALKKAVGTGDPWPESLPVSLTETDVAIARTRAPMGDEEPIEEVLRLYLDMIAAAKHAIYIENQYFTSNALGEALAERLAEPDGPEIIAVLRLSTQGWLEAPTMGTLRTRMLKKLREADRYGRFHAYYPHIPGLPEGQCCDLHSKLLIVDDEYLRIGSANFSNRSMGLDTECDIAIEARGDARIAAAIHDFRNVLLGEHLAVPPAQVEQALQETGTVHSAIAKLASEGRSLRKYERLDEVPEALIAVASVADPEKPVSLETLIEQFSPEMTIHSPRPAWVLPTALLALAAILAVLWHSTPLVQWTNSQRIIDWAADFARMPWAPVLILLAYTPASIVMFPRPLVTLLAVAAFGAWHGFIYAFCGIIVAAMATYALGQRLDRQGVRRIARGRLNRLTQVMRKRGLLAMTAIRLVPLAPFAVVNMMAGAIRIQPMHFVVGTAFGILPGTLIATVFGDQLFAALRDPRLVDPFAIAAVVVLGALLAVSTWFVRRWLFADSPDSHGNRGRPID
ncbi:MAG TPA: VTT domain-containing protein [Steroidobacteraceae bacterium]|nr:VTT domain-containing protein [Steroidobacteraceae bacterium]